jgi:N-acetylglucosaminyl-diphospho-decaprenol L-rhamnosyltransferase
MDRMADVAIVVVSTNEAQWLTPCLSTIYDHAGAASVEVIVVDNSSTDGTRELVESSFPRARVIDSRNNGFAYGNNRGLEQANARYLLLLNPDTEVMDGTFEELVRQMDERPNVGLAGVRQVTGDGRLCVTMRRFPSVSRALGEALFSERWPVHPGWSGERVLDLGRYGREQECDWTSGSFMLVRRETLASAGLLDERFFLQCEEPDLCLRIKRAGWQVRHLPVMTIVHHAQKGGIMPRMVAQETYARKQYARKHFGHVQRGLYSGALATRYLIRAASVGGGPDGSARREAARRALGVASGRAKPPFRPPPLTAVTSFAGEVEDRAAPAETTAARAPRPKR